MQPPEISVIMPVYNGALFLDDAIQSILDQTFTDFELIIINDGSVDRTEEIIQSYHDPRIIYVKNPSNLRLIKTLNRGVKMARGKYIARMDADDISLPERFALQRAVFESKSDADIVNINAFYLQENGIYFREQKSTINLGPEAIRHLSVLQNFISHPGVMLKSELLKHYEYCDDESKEHIEDFDLWNRMLKDGCICYTIDKSLLYYRDNNNSINHTQKERQLGRMMALTQSLLQTAYKLEIDPESLKIILGEDRALGYGILDRINKQIDGYFNAVNRSHTLSKAACKEMDAWKKQKIVLLSLRSLPHCNMVQKAQVLAYLISHLNWFTNKQLMKFVGRAAYSKYQKRIATGIPAKNEPELAVI
ncbi:glycosyltransferase family 2 protein [Dyadobacter chenwenxiniae]|uniref:Glycosyltransferase family 2 protein n=1 Tax=Dyadobacter chenwenxiniae TaxID=2906456 RepID=A0A9X1TLS4_9BACT|nr:glycosyltransferase family A protein [Dyadobacter chenwenxiniae]MCF0062683.1 glycosyltransferase family 2 protein [Dyadobacter chenwenxiniae]UON83572.1 glycosyltransferase family 2 protein [Dyadobacter chenwenxiniae]